MCGWGTPWYPGPPSPSLANAAAGETDSAVPTPWPLLVVESPVWGAAAVETDAGTDPGGGLGEAAFAPPIGIGEGTCAYTRDD